MNRALTGGVGAGSSLALGLRFLDSFSAPALPYVEQPLCPLPGTWDLHWPSLLIGLLLGLLLGPLLEAIVALRAWVLDCTLRRLVWASHGSGKPLYKIC